MRFLYIGQYEDGSTSRMRAHQIKEILNCDDFHVIPLNIPHDNTNRVLRSIGWRLKWGPLISNVSEYVNDHITESHYDCIWVDKAIFIKTKVIQRLRTLTPKLVHYTPDAAFFLNQSKIFFESLPLYDFCITTKSFEIDEYFQHGAKKVLYVTQGYDKTLHKPIVPFEEKSDVSFIGRFEKERGEILQYLLDHGIKIILGGGKWDTFAEKNKENTDLIYLGKGVFGSDYVETLSGSLMSLGFLSKWIPEKHTTRTLEIPACGTALLTEKNEETSSFFSEKEAIFYKDQEDLLRLIQYYSDHKEELRAITEAGYQKVVSGEFDYTALMKNLLDQII